MLTAASEIALAFGCGPLALEAAAADDTPPTFNMLAYNGGKLHVGMFPHPAVVDLASLRVQGGASTIPILRDHDKKRPVGHGSLENDGRQLRVRGTISQVTKDAAEVVAASKNGYQWQASIGGMNSTAPQFVKAGRSIRINGRAIVGPVYVLRGFVLAESSVVSVGADADRATTRIAAQLGSSQMDEFDLWLTENDFDTGNLSDTQRNLLRAQYDAQNEVQATSSTQEEIDAQALAEEKARRSLAQMEERMAQSANRVFDVQNITASYQDRVSQNVLEPLREKALSGEITSDAYELELLRAARPNAVATALQPGYNGADAHTLVAAMSMTAGIREDIIAEDIKEEAGPAAAEKAMNDAYALKGFNLHKLVHACLTAQGITPPVGMMVDENTLGVALQATPKRSLEASGGQFSTISLPGILSRLANKAMLQGYSDYEGTALEWCSTAETNDLKEFQRYRLTESGLLEPLGATGEIKHSTLGEEVHTNKVNTFARMFGVSEEMFINDDMGALTQIPTKLGRMAAHTLENEVYDALVALSSGAATTNFYTSGSSKKIAPNYLTGAGSELTIDSLGQAYKLFLDQIDSDGKPVMVQPRLLLVSTKNAINAEKLFTDTQFRLGSGTAADTLTDNQWRQRFRPIVSPHLGRAGDTQNEDQWYLKPNPTDTAGMNVAYLRGQRVPSVRQAEADFNKLGVQMRIVFRFGVAAWDRRLSVKSDGQ